MAAQTAGSYPLPQYVTQDQDHFDNTNENTWNQAYYVNDTFWVPGSDAPVFVCVGGEGPALTGAAVVDSGESTALSPLPLISHTNMKSPCAEQSIAPSRRSGSQRRRR